MNDDIARQVRWLNAQVSVVIAIMVLVHLILKPLGVL